MSKRLGFFKERYRDIIPSKPFPGYNVTITPSLSNNDTTVNFAITSDLPASLTCDFVLINTVDSDWEGANATGSITLDATGNATLSQTINVNVNYDYIANDTNLICQLNTTEGGQLGTSSNVTFIRGNTFEAIGGTTSQIGSSNLILHSYTITGAQGFNVTSLGGDPANTTVRHLVVGGGGRGGDGYHWYNNSTFDTDPIFNKSIVHYGGGGGAGGVVTAGNITANNYSIANLSLIVGAGSNTQGVSGSSSTLDTIVSVGGGSGTGATVDTANANAATFYSASAEINGPGGGGVRTLLDQYDFRGANGTFTGGTAAQTIAFPGAAGNVFQGYFGIMSGAGANQNSQPSDPYRQYFTAGSYEGAPSPSIPGWVYSPANATIGTTSDITGTSVAYGGGGGGGPVPEFSGGISSGHYIVVENLSGLGVDGGGNGGYPANTAAPNSVTITNNRLVAINGDAELLAQPGVDSRGGGGGGGSTFIQTGSQPGFGVSSQGGKGGDGVVYVSYPYYIRRMSL